MAKNFLARSKSWAEKNKLFGPQAFLKFVIFTYVEALNRKSDDFVFKGGNLLWAYIGTPRATVDLDLATLAEDDDERIKNILSSVSEADGIIFYIDKFESIKVADKSGASVTIAYKTEAGSSNKFDIDIAYATPADFEEITSPINPENEIQAASMENIIADKLMTSHRFKRGNTRLKDYDGLWRISISSASIDAKKLKALLSERKIEPKLDKGWISGVTESAWKKHRKQYSDLPENLEDLFSKVNTWLAKI